MRYSTQLAAVACLGLAVVCGVGPARGAGGKNKPPADPPNYVQPVFVATNKPAADPPKVVPPAVPNKALVTAPSSARRDPAAIAAEIDRRIDEQLTAKGVTPSPAADDAEFIRRVHLDITGRLPASAAVTAFLNGKDPNKRSKLIDELLASPNFGRNFANLWRRALVPPDANQNKPPNYAAFEGWIADQLNSGRPWDQIVRAMLLAEGPVAESPQGIFFIANGDAKNFPQADIITRTTSQAFMGVQLQCAQCHDHPFNDQWKQSDFWGMAAFFGRVQNNAAGNKGAAGGAAIVEKLQQNMARKGKPAAQVGAGGSIVIPPESFHNVGAVIPAKFPAGQQPTLGDVPSLRPAFAAWLTAPENKFFAPALANRVWEHLLGRGFVNPVDDFNPENKPSHPELLEALSKEFVASGFDTKHLIRCICNSKAYQRTSVPVEGNKGDNKLFARMEIKVLGPEALADSLEVALEGRTALPAARGPMAKKGGYPANTPRDHFVNFFNTKEEGSEAGDYSYGIPQALMLMNQVQFNDGASVVERLAKAGTPRDQVIEQLYLATLSRKPTNDELKQSLAFVLKQRTPRDGYSGVLWTLINRSEFVLNH